MRMVVPNPLRFQRFRQEFEVRGVVTVDPAPGEIKIMPECEKIAFGAIH
jgi:hypothetical protein